MIELIIKSLYFMLPAYFANMAPVIVKKIPFLVYPIDFGKTLKSKPVFGKNKTFRGLFFAVLFGIIVAFVQYKLQWPYQIINYSDWLLVGFLLGLGAILGDLIKSFFKRRLSIKPGQRFFPWDQLDFIIGSLIFVSFAVKLELSIIITIVLVSVLGHILVNHAAFYLKIRKEKW